MRKSATGVLGVGVGAMLGWLALLASWSAPAAADLVWRTADNVAISVGAPTRTRRDPDATVRLTLTNTAATALAGPGRLVMTLQGSVSGIAGATQDGDRWLVDASALLPLAGGASTGITLKILGGGSRSFSVSGVLETQVDDGTGGGGGETLSVAITSPESLVTFGATPITVTGDVEPPGVALTVNGIGVDSSSGTFSTQVALVEGHNTIVARIVGSDGTQLTDSVTVSLDLTPPYLTIDSHADQQTVTASPITVTGLINDIVRGTVEEESANVTVNGIAATISNRSYSAANVALQSGANLITVRGTDPVGNTSEKAITVIYTPPVGKRLEGVSGNGQTAQIEAPVAAPLVVKLSDASGAPIADEAVVFRVTQGSGVVGLGTAQEGRAVVVNTGADGMASTGFKLGQRVGSANHKVSAKVVGVDSEVVFSASATGLVGNKISVNSGNNQRGAAGQVLPEPLVVAVTDAGANVVEGARIRFDVVAGGGSFPGQLPSLEVTTDSDGRAAAQFVLGNLEGIDAQRISATLLDGPPGEPLVAGFSASAFVPADPGQTSVSGVVLDNQDQPIPGVTLRIEGTSRTAVADAQGQFKITQAPVGPIRLTADGSTAAGDGEYPSLSYMLVTVAGVDNPLPAPIYMVKLDTKNAVYAGPTDVVLELPAYPGFKLEIAKNSVTFPDGAREGLISVTPVNIDKIPMPPPNGMQPQFIVTIQPTNTRFDPPARLTLPNTDGFPAGAQVDMYSYDHDLEEFVSIGLGTVSEDGSVVSSNPGVGVVKAGWHCGSQPTGSGCCGGGGNGGCPKCQKSNNNNCNGGGCVPDNSQQASSCKKCSGGAEVPDPAGQPTGENAKCEKCGENGAEKDPSKNGTACSSEANKSCYKCKDGKCANNCEANPDKVTAELKSTDIGDLDSVADKLKKAGKFLPPPIEVVGAEAALSVYGTYEEGEKCCQLCSPGKPEKATYKKLAGGYKFDLSLKWGLKGLSGGIGEIIPFSGGVRVVVSWALGPFLTISGSLGNEVSYDISDCEEGNCLTVGVSGALGAKLDVGGSVQAGTDVFDWEKCAGKDPDDEAEKFGGVESASQCFKDFVGVSAELWATGGAGVTASVAISDCPGGDKCEIGLDKVAGKIFYKANIVLPFFTFSAEDVIVEGTLFEGATASCI